MQNIHPKTAWKVELLFAMLPTAVVALPIGHPNNWMHVFGGTEIFVLSFIVAVTTLIDLATSERFNPRDQRDSSMALWLGIGIVCILGFMFTTRYGIDWPHVFSGVTMAILVPFATYQIREEYVWSHHDKAAVKSAHLKAAPAKRPKRKKKNVRGRRK